MGAVKRALMAETMDDMRDAKVIHHTKKLNKPAEMDDYIREMANSGSVFMPPNDLKLPDDLEFGVIGECFANCLLAALSSNGKYLYCEGIGIVRDEVYVHAWLTDASRTVAYDLTWMAYTRKMEKVVAPAYYKGHVLDTEACKNFVLSTHTAGIISNRHARPKLYKDVLKASGIKEITWQDTK